MKVQFTGEMSSSLVRYRGIGCLNATGGAHTLKTLALEVLGGSMATMGIRLSCPMEGQKRCLRYFPMAIPGIHEEEALRISLSYVRCSLPDACG